MELLNIAVIILIVLILIFFILLLFVYRKAFYNDNKRCLKSSLNYNDEQYSKYKDTLEELITNAKKMPFEAIIIKSHDKKKLFAKYYHFCDDAPIDIFFHGYKGCGVTDFAGGILISKMNNHNVLLIDHRGHGNSDGHTISFGVKERFDVLSWINYVVGRFGCNTLITLIGISMGAATVLMASDLNLPTNVKAIIADCPYSDQKEIILKVAKEMGITHKSTSYLIDLSSKLIGHFNINETTPLKSVKNAKIPILLIHGTADKYVPYNMSEQIANTNSLIEFFSFPDAPHGISYITDPIRYTNIVIEFTKKHVK